MGFLEKISSYFIVSYYKQNSFGKIQLLVSYFMAAIILIGLVIATIGLLFT